MGVLSIVWTAAARRLQPDAGRARRLDHRARLRDLLLLRLHRARLRAWYFRRELLKSVRDFFLAGLMPVARRRDDGAIFVKASIDYSQPDTTTRSRCSGSRCRS